MQNLNVIISISFVLVFIIILLIKKYKEYEFKEININEFILKNKNKIIIILFLITLIFISRIYKFGTIPYAIGVDEAAAAYDAYCLANFGVDRYLNSYPLYLINFGGGQSVLYAYLNVLFIKILGNSTLFISRLPALITYLIGIFAAYKLVDNKQDKKTAILFAFLIIICPWQIINSRFGLDCNLLGPMFMLDLLLLETSKKNYQYILAAICVGITLYTYALSYLIMPTFLLVWAIYRLYTKTITIKKVVMVATIIFIFAIPLFYLLLLNMGFVENTQFGIFTIPKLLYFRTNEISLLNIIKYGLDSINTIFLGGNTIYYLQIPFFIIGIIKGIKCVIKSVKSKEYCFISFMTLTFFAILISNLISHITTTNKANIMYIPILYFVTVGIIEVVKNKKVLWQIVILVHLLLFIIFEIYYYTDYGISENSVYEDYSITNVIEHIKNTGKDRENVYICTYRKSEPYIYIMLKNKISPYDFDETKIIEEKKTNKQKTILHMKQVDKYHFLDIDGIKQYNSDRVYIIDKYFKEIISTLEETGYKKEIFERYYIFI